MVKYKSNLARPLQCSARKVRCGAFVFVFFSLPRKGHLGTTQKFTFFFAPLQGPSSNQQNQQVCPQTSSEERTPDIDVPVRPPQTGLNAGSSVRGLGVEKVVGLEVRVEIRSRRSVGRCRSGPMPQWAEKTSKPLMATVPVSSRMVVGLMAMAVMIDAQCPRRRAATA